MQPGLLGASDIGLQVVPHKGDVFLGDTKLVYEFLEDPAVRLAISQITGNELDIEAGIKTKPGKNRLDRRCMGKIRQEPKLIAPPECLQHLERAG